MWECKVTPCPSLIIRIPTDTSNQLLHSTFTQIILAREYTPIQLEQHHTIKATPAQFAFLDNYCHLMQHNKFISKTNYFLAWLCEPKTIWKQNFQAYEKKKMVTICEDGWKKEVIKPCTSLTLVVCSPDMAPLCYARYQHIDLMILITIMKWNLQLLRDNSQQSLGGFPRLQHNNYISIIAIIVGEVAFCNLQ